MEEATPPAGDPITESGDAPVGPSSEEEAAFLAQEQENSAVVASPAGAVVASEPQGELPPMDDLVNRIPAEARELLDELFRARFITVKRVPQSALKERA